MVQPGRHRNPVDTESFAGRVGWNVRRTREKLNLSVVDAASKANMDRATWYRLESGTRASLTGRAIDDVADVLGVGISELVRKVPC